MRSRPRPSSISPPSFRRSAMPDPGSQTVNAGTAAGCVAGSVVVAGAGTK
jgi:hypothetical protein